MASSSSPKRGHAPAVASRQKRAPQAPERTLQDAIGYRFQQPDLLGLALTHRSFRWEQAPAAPATGADNERFEFLGDAVLGLRISERLLERFPQSAEGQLSRLRSWLVSARNLDAAAHRLDLGRYLRLSRAEEAIGGRGKQRLLANATDALIAAIYLDGGYPAAARFIDQHILGTSLEELAPGDLHEFAYKSALQEWAHASSRPVPAYRVLAERGPQHEKIFTVEVEVPGVFTGAASGNSKKAAEQQAAAAALAFLGLLPPPAPAA